MSRIISYRGLLANGGQDTINLHTNDGKTGYKIIKFQCMGPDSSEDIESAIKIYKVIQTAINDTIDFSDNHLLACSIISQSATSQTHAVDRAVIFDNEIFNQDIYVTTSGGDYSASINYYIELKQMDLALDEATVATLKDIRNNN